MTPRRIVNGSPWSFLFLVALGVQVNLAKSSQNTRDNKAEIKKLVGAYKGDRNWTRLWTGLEPLLERNSPVHRQLLRIPVDEEWPLKKASAVPGYLKLITLLLDNGLESDATAGPHAATMLHWASLSGLRDDVELLLSRGARLERRTSGGATALLLAARNGHARLVGELVARGANVSAATHDGWTGLHCAAARGDLELARVLVGAGAPVGALARTRWGRSTPLDVARIHGQPQVEEYLSALEDAAS